MQNSIYQLQVNPRENYSNVWDGGWGSGGGEGICIYMHVYVFCACLSNQNISFYSSLKLKSFIIKEYFYSLNRIKKKSSFVLWPKSFKHKFNEKRYKRISVNSERLT